MRYETAAAFRRALEQRLRSQQDVAIPLAHARKRIVFERFLARLLEVAPQGWVLKGALALDFLTNQGSRTTIDMDIARHDDEEAATEDMLEASRYDLGDFFVFRAERVEPRDTDPAPVRFRVQAELAGRLFDTIIVDVGLSDPSAWEPEFTATPGTLEFAGIPPVSVPVLPIEQQVAEKLHAYTRTYGDGRRSTRTKDFVDLLTIAAGFSLDAECLDQAIKTVFERRGTHEPPLSLPEPPVEWRSGFARLQKEVGRAEGLDEAHEKISLFLDPVLEGSLRGRWDPSHWRWVSP